MNRPQLHFVLIAAVLSACSGGSTSTETVERIAATPLFETRTEVPTGTNVHADFVVADLDHDQQVDMAVIGLGGELQLMMGNQGSFSPGQRLELGGVPVWIDKGDLDGDLDCDLAVVRTDAGEVTVLLNDGNGTFTQGPSLAVGPQALSVVVADANDDAIADLIISRPGAPELQVFLNDGQANFVAGSAFTLPNGGSPFTMEVGDVTRDGLADLVVSDPDRNRVLVYRGSPSTADFDPVPYELYIAGAPKASSLGDLNGDGFTDIAVSAFDNNEFVIVTDMVWPVGGGLTTYTATTVPVSGPPSLSVIGDFTGDGLDDLAACVVSRSAMVIIPQAPGGGFAPLQQLDASGLPLRPAKADVDNNGRSDLLVLSGLNDRINMWLAREDGRLLGARNYDTGLTTAAYAQIADLDGDGRNEVVVGNNFETRLAIMGDDGNGDLWLEHSIDVGADVFNVRLSDIDGDGRDDILVPVSSGVKVVQNLSTPGNYEFAVHPGSGALAYGIGTGPFGVTAADLNGDARKDLVIVNFASGELQVLIGEGAPFEFGSARSKAIGYGPIDVVTGDFTGDGITDVAVSRSGQADILVFQNDGIGNLSMWLSLPVGTSPNYLVSADFNGDNRADLVVSNGTDSSVSVLYGGSNGFTRENYAAGRTPTALLARDVNDDGAADILVTSMTGGDFRLLVNQGDGAFTNVISFPGTAGASGAAMGDLDGDGLTDLVIASLITNRVSMVRGLGSR